MSTLQRKKWDTAQCVAEAGWEPRLSGSSAHTLTTDHFSVSAGECWREELCLELMEKRGMTLKLGNSNSSYFFLRTSHYRGLRLGQPQAKCLHSLAEALKMPEAVFGHSVLRIPGCQVRYLRELPGPAQSLPTKTSAFMETLHLETTSQQAAEPSASQV